MDAPRKQIIEDAVPGVVGIGGIDGVESFRQLDDGGVGGRAVGLGSRGGAESKEEDGGEEKALNRPSTALRAGAVREERAQRKCEEEAAVAWLRGYE